MTRARQAGTLASLTMVSFLLLFLVSPVAGAASVDPVGSPPGPGGSVPVALATTGLDITVPVVVGLCTLVLGISLVSWAVLRRGSVHHRHQ